MSTGKNSILIIDDEASNLKLLTHMLGQEYTVYAAKGGQAGIELAKKHQPGLILLDIIMPEMDGYEVLSLLKSSDETRAIPVIITTGLDTSEEKSKGLEVADFIGKPFNSEVVKSKVRALMQNSE